MLAWLALPSTAAKAQAKLAFEMYAGGLHALQAELTLDIDGAAYRARSRIATRGFLDFLARWHAEQETVGELRDGSARPRLHTRDSEWHFDRRRSRLEYDGQGGVTVSVNPPPEDDDRPPVPAALRRNTVDLLSLLVRTAVQSDPATACSGDAAVYDGRRRYDVAFTVAGEEVLKPQAYGSFSGTALHCRVAVTPVAGFRADAGEESGLGMPKDVSVWLTAEAALGLVVPVRFEADFPLGTVIGHLTDVSAAP
jgi:hypothetical protein